MSLSPMLSNGVSDNAPMLSYKPAMPAPSYYSASLWMGSKTDRPFPHGRATRVVKREDNGIAIRYHETQVVTYYPDRIVLDSGGYHTLTTKARINEALSALDCHVSLSQIKGVWYLSGLEKNPLCQDSSIRVDNPNYDPSKSRVSRTIFGVDSNWDFAYDPNPAYDASQPYWITLWRVPFVDDIHIDYRGNLINIDQAGADREIERITDTTRLISQYVRKTLEIVDQVHNTTEDTYDPDVLPLPSGGDCWYCVMTVLHPESQPHRPILTDETLGDRIGYSNPDNHLMSHLQEQYIVPSLLVSALREYGSPVSRWTLQALMEGNVSSDFEVDHLKRMLRSSLNRYFKVRLGIGR
jgi:hypothetical protein